MCVQFRGVHSCQQQCELLCSFLLAQCQLKGLSYHHELCYCYCCSARFEPHAAYGAVGQQAAASPAFNELCETIASDYVQQQAAAEKQQQQQQDKQQQDQSPQVQVVPLAAAAKEGLRELLGGLGQDFSGYLDALIAQKLTVAVLGSGSIDAGTLLACTKMPVGDAVQVLQAARAAVASQANA
jgi:hypothetical protein